jgi:hypothetical protein
LSKGQDIEVKGLPDGAYVVEFWDTYAGKVLTRETVACEDAALRLRLPAANRDFAFKIKPATPIPLKVERPRE